MTDRPLISIVTPTIPERHELLMACIENVRAQSYRPLEHVIVSDGPDFRLADRMKTLQIEEMEASIFAGQHGTKVEPSGVPIFFQELGRPWSPLLPHHSTGVAPILTGLLLARGEYLAWQCDDEAFTDPDALALLADLLETTDADFVYPKVRMWWNGTSPERGWDIGTDPPEYGEFTWCLFRADLLRKTMPRFHAPTFNDWDLCERWIAVGARHAFLDRVLVTHRADR